MTTATGTSTATACGATATTTTTATVVVALWGTTTASAWGRSRTGNDRSAFDAIEVGLVILVKLLASLFLVEVVSAFNEDGALV